MCFYVPCGLFDTDLWPNDIVVYITLCMLANDNNEVREYSQREIADTAVLHHSTVAKSLKKLAKREYIDVLKKDYKENRGSDHYVLNHHKFF